MTTFYFAWVDSSETTFGPAHEVEDERVFSLEIRHKEGGFAVARVDVVNPGAGLLAAGRKRWAWIAVDLGDSAGAQALFFGRLLGLPAELEGETVTLELIARPLDFDAQKRALAETLKVAPYWDPVWLARDRRDDPDAVLEARNALWHIDRVDHAVTISDFNAGEDGTIDLAGTVYYDASQARPQQPPVRKVRLEAEVQWTQEGAGTIDLAAKLAAAFKAAGTTQAGHVSSYTGEGLLGDWPRDGQTIGAGWRVAEASALRGDGIWLDTQYKQVLLASAAVQFPLWRLKPTLKLGWLAQRARTERVVFDLESDMQAMLTEAGEDEVLLIALASAEIAEPIDDDGGGGFTAPMSDVRRSSYFLTDRGRQSMDYVLALARARLLARARAVDVTVETDFASGLALSCRKNARVADARLPGGEATGKVSEYALKVDGDAGTLVTEVTIGCTVGRGASVSASAGTPDYVEDGYVEDGYQTRTSEIVVPIAGEVGYTTYGAQGPSVANGGDDGVDLNGLTPAAAVTSLTVTGGQSAQESVLDAGFVSLAAAEAALNEAYTEYEVVLVPLDTGPFEHEIAVAVTDLMVPKTIDLEAGGT